MPTVLLPADLQSLNQILIDGGVKQYYAVLQASGYGYAAWALGVAGSMGMPTIAAADYLRGTALMGISSPIFQILSRPAVDKLRADIAKSHLRLLCRLARDTPDGDLDRDISGEEAWKLYGEGLQRNGLGTENWNLHFPLAILKRLAGHDALERFWCYLRDARLRPSHVGILTNLATVAFMYKQTMSRDIKCRQMAMAWLNRNPSLHTCAEIERKLDAGLRLVNHLAQPELLSFLEVLDIEAHGLSSKAKPRPSWPRRLTGAAPDPELIYRALLRRLTS